MLEVEVISKISHEQVLSYEPNCLNCIRTVGGKEKKKIYVTLRNLKKQELNVQLTLKYEVIKLKKRKRSRWRIHSTSIANKNGGSFAIGKKS